MYNTYCSMYILCKCRLQLHLDAVLRVDEFPEIALVGYSL